MLSTKSQSIKFLPVQTKESSNAEKTLQTILDVPNGKVNEENFSIFHNKENGLVKSSNFSVDLINKRDVYKISEPLKESFTKADKKIVPKSKSIAIKDPLSSIMKKQSAKRKNLKLDNKIFNSETLEICNVSDYFGKNTSFNISFKKIQNKDAEFFTPVKATNSKKLKKPKILKSDGKTVTAESVLRMVDPSFLVCSDIDDSSMVSMNTSANMGSSSLKLNNVLEDINNFDQIDRFLSITESKTQKSSSLRNRLL